MNTPTDNDLQFEDLDTAQQEQLRVLAHAFQNAVQADIEISPLPDLSIPPYLSALNAYFPHLVRNVLGIPDDEALTEEKHYSVRWHLVMMIAVGCVFLDQHTVRAILTQALVDVPELDLMGGLFHDNLIKQVKEEQ